MSWCITSVKFFFEVNKTSQQCLVFSRPSVPRRSARSETKLKLDNEDEKDSTQIYNQSYINNDAIIEEIEIETKTEIDSETNNNNSKIDKNKLDIALKQRKSKDPSKLAPAIQDAARKLEHAKKSDNINQKLEARQDIDEMLDHGIMPADPRKVHGSLHEKQATLSEVLNDRASKEFLQRTKILKYDKIVKCNVYLHFDMYIYIFALYCANHMV